MPNDFLIFQRFFWPLHFFGLPLHRKSGNTVSILYFDSVAQLVEQMTLNHWVESSSLSGVTIKNSITFKLRWLSFFRYRHLVD